MPTAGRGTGPLQAPRTAPAARPWPRPFEQAHALVHTHLCDAARRCYLLELLRRYGAAMAYKPSLRLRKRAMRVTNIGQLKAFPRRTP